MRTRNAQLAVLFACIAVPAAAHAQAIQYTPGFDPEQLQVTADPGSIGLMDGARPLGMRSYAANIMFGIGGPPLDACVKDVGSTSDSCDVEGDIINTRVRSDLGFIFGFGRFDVRALLPIVLHQSSDFPPSDGMAALRAGGIGDLRLGGRVLIAKVSEAAFAFDLSFTLPTGGGDNFVGDSGELIDPKFLFDWRHNKIAAEVSLGYRYRQKSAELANLYVDDELTWSVGGQYEIQPQKLSAGLALFGHIGVRSNPDPMDFAGDLGSEEMPAEVLASARYFVIPKVAIEGGLGTALTPGYGAPPFRVLLGVRYVDQKKPRVIHDTDHDGILDEDDQCVTKPEDVDDFEDLDGCPEADNDGDGILDDDDQCKNIAEDMNGFEDEDGCPEQDSDSDGLVDGKDACPKDPEDMDGFRDDDGCPDIDIDGDGILDEVDGPNGSCMEQAEDMDQIVDDDGCPETDADGDGIVDTADKCPLEPENFNDHLDEDGCPDEGRTLVDLTSEGVSLNDVVYFDFNKAKIKKKSYKLLNAVASVLKAHPDLYVRIEGHTDDQGTVEWNQELSQHRSEAVMDYLVKKGIPADHLKAIGYGSSRPLVNEDNEKAHAKNRRVEFVIDDEAMMQANPEAPEPAPQP